MYSFVKRLSPPAPVVLLAFGALMLAGCSSSEERAQGYYQHGKELVAKHDYARAGVELRNALRLKKDMLPAWRLLAQTQEDTKAWGALTDSLRSIVELDPADTESRLKLTKLLLLGGSADEILKLADAAPEAESRNPEILALKAAAHYKLKDNAAAVSEAKEALSIDPGISDARVVLATDRIANNDAKGALQILESGPEPEQPDLGIALFKLKLFEQFGDAQKREALLRKLIASYPQETSFRRQLIRFYLDQRRPDEAEKELRAMIAATPESTDAELDLVRFLLATKGKKVARQELVGRIEAGGEVFRYQLALADFDFAQGDVSESERELQDLANHAGSPAQVLAAQTKLAEAYLSTNKASLAEPVISDILQKDGRNTAGLKLRASMRLDRGELEPAISDLRQALNDQPQSSDLMLLLALAYERSGSIELAEKQYADALRASNFNPTVGLNYVAFLQRRGSRARAEDVLTELSTRLPNNLDVLTALAQAKLSRQDWNGAQALAERIRKLGDTRTVAEQILGAAFVGMNKYNESITAFQNAVDAAPNALQPMIALIRALVRANQTDRAKALLQERLKANPDDGEMLVLLGTLQVATNNPAEALANFQLAIEKQPKDVIGYQAVGNLYLTQKKYDDALKIIRAGLQVQPDSAVLQLLLAGGLEFTGQYDAAIAEYEHMLAQQPGSLIVVNNLASMLSDHRSDKASLERAQSLAAVLRKSQVPQFKDTLGWVSYREGDYRTAVPLLEEAAAALPGSASVRYHLGMGYASVSNEAKAAEEFKAALRLAPDSDLEAKIRAALAKLPG
jgi:tetratricopeptide (TPR) repeat protein